MSGRESRRDGVAGNSAVGSECESESGLGSGDKFARDAWFVEMYGSAIDSSEDWRPPSGADVSKAEPGSEMSGRSFSSGSDEISV